MSDKMFSEEWAVVGVIDPDANTVATVLTAAIDMADYEQIAVVSLIGTLGASATVVTTVTASATSSGTYATVAGKTTTQGGGSPIALGSDTQTIINVRSSEITSNKRYVKVSMQVTAATTDCGMVVFGQARHRPASDADLASVDEIVS